MGASGRRPDPSVADLLLERGYQFDFFQAVRLLSLLYVHRKEVGRQAQPHDEVVRFGQRLSLEFPPSAVHRIDQPGQPDGGPVRMMVAFMGFVGRQGVLPLHYTELMVARQMARDTGLVAFLDLFHHRLVGLFYRAWEKHHFFVAYERGAAGGEAQDHLTPYLFDLIGMGTEGLRGRGRIQDLALLRYAGLIAQRPHSASALAGMLRDYFGVAVEVEQFRGQWFSLQELCYLGPPEVSNQLGVGAIAGDQVWIQAARFRVQVGPVGLERFQAFLPGGPALAELAELTRFFVGEGPEFDVQLILRAEEVPWCRLSEEGAGAPRLGWVAWLKTEPFQQDACDTILTIQ